MRITSPTSNLDNAVKDRLQNWTEREIQLTRLHEEIVTKREALVQYSMTYVESQLARKQSVNSNFNKAIQRNEQFLEDLQITEDRLYQESINPPSPRLVTLQNNYWSMVKSLKPLWEQSLQQKSSSRTSKRPTSRPSKPKRIIRKK